MEQCGFNVVLTLSINVSNIESASCRHRLPCLHRSYGRHRSDVWHQSSIVSVLLTSNYHIYICSHCRHWNVISNINIVSTSPTFNIIVLHRSNCRHHNVVRYRISIALTLLTSNNLTYLMNIVEIAILDDIESTLCRHPLPLITLCTSFKSSTSQCCTISNQHRIDIAYLQLPWLDRPHRRHRSVIRYRINIVSTSFTSFQLGYIVYIVEIAMLYDVESTSCWYWLPPITLFTSFTSSISQCYTISNTHHVDIAYLLYPCLHGSHLRQYYLVRCRINILSNWIFMKYIKASSVSKMS